MEEFSFCIFDAQQQKYVALKSLPYAKSVQDYNDLNKGVAAIIAEEPLLQLPYKEVLCMYPNRCCTLVPSKWAPPPLFKQQLELNHVLSDLDEINVCPIPSIDAECLFAVPGPLSAKLFEKLGRVTYVHQSALLVQNLMQWKDVCTSSALFAVNIGQDYADIALCAQGQCKLYNTFTIRSANDLVYFLMLIAQQYKIENGQSSLLLSGNVDAYMPTLSQFFADILHTKLSPEYYVDELHKCLHPRFDLLFSLVQCVS
ncbi:hypothetical protein FACS1894156_0670 [Bacteroidia bacterium]|nr:hypothetical protein FACS1894156_0670 [Bacteroidia bacterium]